MVTLSALPYKKLSPHLGWLLAIMSLFWILKISERETWPQQKVQRHKTVR